MLDHKLVDAERDGIVIGHFESAQHDPFQRHGINPIRH